MKRNIDNNGRRVRAVGALLLGGGALALWSITKIGSLVLAAGTLFVAFEAARGWCAFRACGVKTPL